MNASTSKPYLSLAGKPIICHTLAAFEQCPLIDTIILVVEKEEINRARVSIVDAFGFKKIRVVVAGGERRQDSVWEGIKVLAADCDLVVVHDGARPFISRKILERSIEVANAGGTAVVAVPVKDTIKVVREERITKTLDRTTLWAVQTPQTFRHAILKKAYEKALEDGYKATDDASLVERMGISVEVVEGSYDNIKITTPEDLVLGEAILKGNP